MKDFAKLPSALSELLRTKHERHVPNGQIILYEGDAPAEIFILKAGVVKIYDIDSHGNEKILHLVKAPAVLPFAFFSDLENPLQWFYSALTDCRLSVILAEELQEMILHDAQLTHQLTHDFSLGVHELLVRLSSLNKTNVHDKLVAALKFLVVCHAVECRAGWWRVNFSVNQQLLCDLCGVTRESVAATMKELQSQKIVRCPRVSVLEIKRDRLCSL